MTDHIHRLDDGRGVGVTGYGDPDATRLVVFCHPSPGSGAFDPDPTVTASIGVRLLTLDRPGYGASDPMSDAERPMDAWIADVDQYLRFIETSAREKSEIDFGAVGIIGWGAGAMYASALAGRHPALVERLVLVEPTAPTVARVADESTDPLDARLLDVDALAGLDDYPGAADRMGFMLDEVSERGAAGPDFDRRVLADATWQSYVDDVTCPTLIIGAGVKKTSNDDANWYRRRIASVDFSSKWAQPSTSIVEAWTEILTFLQPRMSTDAERLSRRRGGSALPQVGRRPR